MEIGLVISNTRDLIAETFSAIDTWFDKDGDLRNFRPASGGWTIDEILEDIGLTNHFLLILIDKATLKALSNIHNLDLQTELQNYNFQGDKLLEIGLHKSFAWTRPDHMEPTGNRPLPEVRAQLQEQKLHCLETLDKLQKGEGVLYKTTMSVNGLGKIDVYEYIHFLAQHGQRHITQMQKIEAEYALGSA